MLRKSYHEIPALIKLKKLSLNVWLLWSTGNNVIDAGTSAVRQGEFK